MSVKHSAWAAISALPTDAPVITNFSAEDTVLGGIEMRGGALVTNATWNQTGIVYLLTNDFTIGNGATLTIQPGVTVKFLYGCCSFNKQSLLVEGTLAVNGTSTQKVYFTSTLDDAIGGDTNNDGGATQPKAGDWENIHFLGGSQGNFTHTVIRYAGISRTHGAVHVKNAQVTLSDSVVSNSFIGLFVDGAPTSAHQSSGSAASTITKSDLSGNSEYAVFTQAGGAVIANSNWWGDNKGPAGKVAGDVTVADWCADANCVVIVKPAVYMPLVRR